MRAAEELARKKLEKRVPDKLLPKPYELRAPQGSSLLFPTAMQTESQNPTGVKLHWRLIVKHGFLNTTETTKRFYQEQQQQIIRPHYRLTQRGKRINP